MDLSGVLLFSDSLLDENLGLLWDWDWDILLWRRTRDILCELLWRGISTPHLDSHLTLAVDQDQSIIFTTILSEHHRDDWCENAEGVNFLGVLIEENVSGDQGN